MLKERSVSPLVPEPLAVSSIDRRGRPVLKVAVLLLACFTFAQGSSARSEQKTRRVLIVYEQGLAAAAIALIDREIRGVLEGQSTYHIDFYTEYMDRICFPTRLYRKSTANITSRSISAIGLT